MTRFVLAIATTAAAGSLYVLWQPEPRALAGQRATMSTIVDSRLPIEIVLGNTSVAHVIVLEYADRQASLLLPSDTGPLLVALPPTDSPASLTVRTSPPSPVTVTPVERTDAQMARWVPLRPSDVLPAPKPSTRAGQLAHGPVDETDTYGLRLFGVPLRSQPTTASETLATVYHGDQLTASCWTHGDEISNGFANQVFDDDTTYTSDIWYLVKTWNNHDAYIPDTRFVRDQERRLGLPACDEPLPSP